MTNEVEKDIAKFKKNFDYKYQPKFGYCPACIKTNIMQYYEVSFEEAIEIYQELATYPSALVRFNDYLYESIEKYKTIGLKVKKK